MGFDLFWFTFCLLLLSFVNPSLFFHVFRSFLSLLYAGQMGKNNLKYIKITGHVSRHFAPHSHMAQYLRLIPISMDCQQLMVLHCIQSLGNSRYLEEISGIHRNSMEFFSSSYDFYL